MRKVSKLFLLISLSFLLTFNSCNNVFENTVSSDDEVQTASAQAAKKTPDEESPAAGNTSKSKQPVTIEFGGSLKLKGAVPAEFVEKDETPQVQNNSRSANAQLPTGSDYEYYVTATSNDGIVKEDVIPVSSVSKDYTLQLEINKTWTFTAGFRKNASGTPGTDSYVAPKDLLIDINTSSGHPYTLTLSETTLQPATQKTFILSPLQTSTGRGTINLNMTAPESGAGITELKLFTSGANGLLQPWQPWAEGESPNLDVSLTQIKTKENMTIASGSYDVTMIFYKHDTSLNKDFQAYISYQTINVFDNMETKVWESGNAPGTESIISGGSFQLTTSLVQKFASSTIYVGAPEGVTVEPDDSRVGSPYAPVKTLNRAFEIIKANTSGDGNTRDYRILVTTAKPTADKAAQPQKANLEIPDTITSAQARSIEIIGQGSGTNLAVLEPAAGNSAGTILTVNTTVPVTLRNIKLAGGKGSGGKGGALSITKNSAKVTLESGTVISGNSASDQGGGIYIQGSDASHKPKLIIKAGAEIKSNSIDNGGTGGMAIFADCAQVEMTGGEISGNSKAGAQYGAVRLTGASEFTMTGGSVANNDGGAFYVDSDYDAGTSTYTQSKLKIGGSARIPYGNSQTKNDVFVKHAGPDGGKYSPVCIKTQGLNLQSDSKIAITPDEWQRGLDILEADNGDNGDIESYKDYFLLTDGDFNFSKSGSNVLFAKLKAPIYVGPNGVDTPTPAGTKEAPFRTLNRAVLCLAGGEPDVIKILGKVELEQSISSSFNTTLCSALTIKGEVNPNHPNDVPGIYVQEGHNTSALTLDTSVPVTIENLKITGGQGTAESSNSYGGGIYLKSGTLKLGNGVQITGNKAMYGGGVCVNKGASLFMYGTAVIGDFVESTATGTIPDASWTNCANYASMTGGGIFNRGSVCLGYSGTNEGTLVPAEFTGGVRRNLSNSSAGGIDSNGTAGDDRSILKIRSGYVSYNKANNAGGGIRAYQTNIEIYEGEISYNNGTSGGGMAVAASTDVLFNGGIIKENSASTTDVHSGGGAVDISEGSSTVFTMLGSASIPYGVTESGSLVKARGKNDVFLSHVMGNTLRCAYIRIGGSLSTDGNVATISMSWWQRGAQFLQAGDTLTSLPDGVMDKFSFTDPGWDKKRYTKSSTNDAAKIDADIYVAGSDPAKCKTSDGASAPTDTDNTIGNWAHPFASISAALSSGLLDASHDTIIVDGTVSSAQSISGTGSLSAVAIKGYKATGATSSSAKIDAGGGTSAGSALTVNADGKTVTIQDLTITGGRATNGGGINITKGSVALGTGAKVTGNIASESGGGVYLYGSDAKLFMYDSSLIGDDATSTTIATDGTSAGPATFANKAVKHGGGIYNNGGAVYIGYSGLSGGTPVKSDMTNGGGVRRNISTTSEYHAGGILNRNGGTVRIASGSISYNFSTTHGGGLYNNNDAGEVLIEAPQNAVNKVVFEGNHAKGNGGAIFNRSTLSMSAGQIGGSTSGLQNTVDSGAKGGAIFQDGSFTISDSAVVYAGSETVNDVCLGTGERTITVGSLSGSGTVASITPASWSRGINILSATSEISSDVYNRFVLSKDNAGWDRANNNAESTKYVFITSPIYVVDATDSGNTRPTGFNKGVTTGANGTKTSPYASVADALACADLATVKEITVAGTLKGAQTISSMSISELKLKGYKPAGAATSSAKIDAGSGTSAGSALTVNKSGLTVTITDLTITGGSGSSMTVGGAAQTNGGGILLNAGTVKLSDGAVITGNAVANNGGGVYLAASGCALYMSGKALIGDSATSTTRASSAANNRANQAANGAGIYNNGGSVFIGSNTSGTAASGYSLVNDDTNGHYGVRRNYSTTSGAGAGIYHAGGTLKIASGDVSLNNAGAAGAGTCNGGGVYCAADVDISGGTFKNNYAANGGGLYIATGKKATVNGAAVFTQNQSWVNGGAVYNAGEFTMSAGTIGGSNSSDANLAAGSAGLASYGGAIYQGGTFNISGSAYVYPGSVKSNDVYLPSEKVVTINSNYTGAGNNGTDKMALTPAVLKRGISVLGGASCSTTNAGYFMITDSEWSILTESAYKGKLDAQLWVAGTSNTANGVGTPDTGANGALGTKSKPYSTISEAVNQCWNSNRAFTIYLSGTITGETQTIPAANSTEKTGLASSITIEGFTGNTSDVIDMNLDSAPASGGSALTISTATPVTIKKIKITKGYAAANGGGISVNGVKGASLTLGEGALITANKASYNGGGIYIGGTSDGKANLIMNSTATVSANSAGTHNGGGVYLEYANLCMSGRALIGDTGVTGITYLGGNSSNSAARGGGVYCSTGSKIYLGCNTSGETSSGGVRYELSPGYGICHNYSTYTGGGVDLRGSMTIKSGSVSYNATRYDWAGSDGGGIWQASGTTIEMSGGTIAKNKADHGGGVYAGGNFTMTGGTIGDSSDSIDSPAENGADKKSNSASYGGGIYAPSGASVSISGGYINYNYASSYGGGICWEGSTLSVTDGNISYNYGGYGGGIYFYSNATLTKATFTKNNASSGGALYINSGKEVTVSGAAAFTGNTASSGGAIYNDGTFKLTGGATFTSNSASTSGGAVYNDETFIMSGSASISAGSGAKNNDIGLASGKKITTDGLSTTGTVGLVTPYSYYENETVITKGSNCGDTQFKVDTGKFILTPESNDYEWYIKNDGTISQGRGANVSNIEDVLKNIPENENRYDVHVCGPVSQDDFASIVSAMNQCTGHVLLDLTTATFTETINTNNLFKNCTKLEEIAFDVNTLPLSSTMFSGCENLDRLYIQGNVTSWPNGIFNNCGHLASIEFKNATSVTIPGTDYISYDGMVIMLPTTLTTLTLGPLDSTVYQYMCGIRYNGTREDFKNSVSVSKTSANIETKAMINCYGESGGPRVYWKGYASGTAGGHFVEYTDWDTAY